MIRRGRGRGRGKLTRPLASKLQTIPKGIPVADISGDLRTGAAAATTTTSAANEPVAGPSRASTSKAIYYAPITEIGPSKKKQKTEKGLESIGRDEQPGNEPEAGSSRKGNRSDKSRKIASSSQRSQPLNEDSAAKRPSKKVTFAPGEAGDDEDGEDDSKYNRLVSLRNLGNSKGKFLHSLRTVTKLKMPPPRTRLQPAEDVTDNFDFDTDTQESLEICQGISKIKLHDWHPFFDMEHNKRNPPDLADDRTTSATSSSQPRSRSHNNQGVTVNGDGGEDEEWEETLIYVDLEDIPDVDGLLSSLAPRGASTDDVGLSHLEMKIYDMDSKLPVLQLGGRYLAGHYEDTVGTSLFFKKNTDADEDAGSSPHSSTEANGSVTDSSKLKNIVPAPEIPFDPVYGENYLNGEDGYELVAKSFKVLKARYFPVVNEVVKKEDILHDSDEEFDQRDFQIPPINMVRQYMTKDFDYEKYIEADIKRRKEIREKWLKPEKKKKKKKKSKSEPIIKSEPLDIDYTIDDDDDSIQILDAHLDPFLENVSINSEPKPGTSKDL